MSILWTDKYKPEKISDISGQGKALKEIEAFFSGWKKGKALLISGGSGTGKTLSVEAFCKEKKMQLLMMNASDSRSPDEINAMIGESSQIKPLFHSGKVILIDELDGISSTEKGAAKSIIDIIKKSSYPVVLIANDPWILKLRALRAYCAHVKFGKVTAPSIEKKLKSILDSEKISYDETAIKNLARWSGGDLRSAIIDLQAVSEGESSINEDSLLSLGYRERESDMFSILPTIFRSGRISAAKKLIWDSDKDADMVFWWIENNIPIEFSGAKELQRAYDIISKADIFRSYVSKQQNWRFKAYMVDMMAGISVGIKEEPKGGWIKYEMPQKIMMMAATKGGRAEVREVHEKICTYTHISGKALKRDLLPYLKIMLSSSKFLKKENDENGKKPKTASLMSFSQNSSPSNSDKLKLSTEEIALLLG